MPFRNLDMNIQLFIDQIGKDQCSRHFYLLVRSKVYSGNFGFCDSLISIADTDAYRWDLPMTAMRICRGAGIV